MLASIMRKYQLSKAAWVFNYIKGDPENEWLMTVGSWYAEVKRAQNTARLESNRSDAAGQTKSDSAAVSGDNQRDVPLRKDLLASANTADKSNHDHNQLDRLALVSSNLELLFLLQVADSQV